jgi:hypothetical protein
MLGKQHRPDVGKKEWPIGQAVGLENNPLQEIG